MKPASRRPSIPAGHGSIRVHGTWKTVPIETRIALRYKGSAHRGVMRTASTPRAAALRKIAPTFVWSTTSSMTMTRSRPADDLGDGRQGRPLHRGQGPAVQVEAGARLDDVVGRDVDGDSVGLGARDEVGEVGHPALGHEVGPRPVPCGQRPADDLLALRDVEAALGLGPPPQRDVGEGDVVLEPRVGRVGDRDWHGHRLGEGDELDDRDDADGDDEAAQDDRRDAASDPGADDTTDAASRRQ